MAILALPEAGLLLADNTTGDVSTSRHGFAPKAPNDTSKFLRGDGTWNAPTATAVEYGKIPGGRLTLESGVPVSITDQAAKTTIYYTPYVHDQLWAYTGSTITRYTFAEISLSSPSLTSGKNYDVFVYDSSGTLTLELSSAWTNDTTRADALAWQSGLGWVKSGTATRFWLGTIRASATNQMSDVGGSGATAASRFVANAYNRVPRSLWACPGYTDGNNLSSYSVTSTTCAAVNGGTGATAGFVVAVPTDVEVRGQMYGASSGGVVLIGAIGLDTSTSPQAESIVTATLTVTVPLSASGSVSAGYHYSTLCGYASGAGTLTVYSDDSRRGHSADPALTFMRGLIWI